MQHTLFWNMLFSLNQDVGEKLALDPQVPPTEIQVPWADSGGHDVYLTNFLHDFDTNGPWTPG